MIEYISSSPLPSLRTPLNIYSIKEDGSVRLIGTPVHFNLPFLTVGMSSTREEVVVIDVDGNLYRSIDYMQSFTSITIPCPITSIWIGKGYIAGLGEDGLMYEGNTSLVYTHSYPFLVTKLLQDKDSLALITNEGHRWELKKGGMWKRKKDERTNVIPIIRPYPSLLQWFLNVLLCR